MDERGFGIPELFAFALFVVLTIFTAYNFITKTITPLFEVNSNPNYVNAYKKYYKNGVLTVNATGTHTSSSENIVVSGGTYSALENSVENATALYVNDNYSYIYENDPLFIRVSSLKNNGYLIDLRDINDGSDCSGYTRVEKINNQMYYDAFIKCSGYTTDGYVSRIDD